MDSPPPPRAFDQTSSITARLRDLVRSYPKGPGLVKEFLQNADDAGASFLHVTYDRRRHPGRMNTSEQEIVLGPALLFANNSLFTERDLKNIQHIDSGGKLHEAQGIGRFGQGFNSSYSVSDHPSLLTGDWVVWFDPHGRAHGGGRNAWAWSLSDSEMSWPAWVATFRPAGLLLGAARFEGTVFRLPLRNEAEAERSEINEEAFTDRDFNVILDEVRKLGPALLVFLRSVLSLRIDEISPDGTHRTRYEITTINPAEVDAARAPLRNAVQGDPRGLLKQWMESQATLPVAAYAHTFQVRDEDSRRECAWSVVTGLYRGPDNDLLRLAQTLCGHREKALPWAGAAAPWNASDQRGGLACFLPLADPSPWPVFLHGWFDVDSSRRGITRQAGTGETAQFRIQWNEQLLRHGVGSAWAALIQLLPRDVGPDGTDPYRLWPRSSEVRDAHDQSLVDGFYADISMRPVFRCMGPGGVEWRSLARMGGHFWGLDAAWHQQLRDPLLHNRNTLLEPPLPALAVTALGGAARILSAEDVLLAFSRLHPSGDVCCTLNEAPHPALTRPEWVVSLARFCAQKGLDKLAGLPFALLADGKLHTFGECGPIYLVNDAERLLLAGADHRFLEPRFQADVGLTGPVEALGLKRLGVAGLVEVLREYLVARAFDDAWWVQLFDHLEQLPPAEVRANHQALKSLLLIPDQRGHLHTMGSVQTPLFVNKVPTRLSAALNELGVPMVSGSEALIGSIRGFASRHEGFVRNLGVDDLLSQLEAHSKTPWLCGEAFSQRAVLDPLLDFLSTSEGLREDDPRVGALRRLPMLPTSDGAIVSAETPDLFVPGGFVPPQGIDVRHRLLEPGEGGQWSPFFKSLRVPEQDVHAFVVAGLLPAFGSASNETRLGMLHWLRDHLHVLKATLLPEKRTSLEAEIRKVAILPLQGGGLGAPANLYRPDAEEALKVLGKFAKVPDMAFLGGEPQSWNVLFADLQLHSTPRASHLIEAVQGCISEAEQYGASTVRERLDVLREYIVRHWDSYGNIKKNGSQKFVDALNQFAWLPAEAARLEDVAAAVMWPNRLFRPCELAAPGFLHLIASSLPVLQGEGFPSEMAKAIGLRTQIPFVEIRQHFAKVRLIDQGATGDKVRTACRAAFEAFAHHVAELSETEAKAVANELTSLQQDACVLLRGRWWRPLRVYLESLPFAASWCVSLLEDSDLARQPRIIKGLTRLGARPRPKSLDWVEMLNEQGSRIGDRALSDEELVQVEAALQQLRVENREWLQAQTINVPTHERQLLPARQTLIPDDPRLKRLPAQCRLPLVEEIEVSLDIAGKAGARSLQGVLIESLADEPTPSQDSDLLAWMTRLTQKIRSPEFNTALRRLARHGAIERGDNPDDSTDKRLDLARRLTIRVARDLRVLSRFHDTGECVFEQQAGSFWDQKAALLWLLQAKKRKMGDELARTLATECRVEALRLSRLLEVEPTAMADLLDEDGIAMIPAGAQGAAAPLWFAPDSEFELADTTLVEGYDRESASLTDTGMASMAKTVEPVMIEGPGLTPAIPPSRRSGSGAGPESFPEGWSNAAGAPEDDALLTDFPAVAPTTPGFGSSNPWSPDSARSQRGGATRLRSYVHRDAQADYDTSTLDPEKARHVRREAVQRVIDWERKEGRDAVEVADPHLGYDLASSGTQDSLLIKVKGLDGAWTARGVEVTRGEFQKALEAGSAWWLYVVEHALDPVLARVHALRNPFLEAFEHRFDQGWRVMAVAEKSQPEGPVEGEELVLPDGRGATVIEVEQRGQLWMVTLGFAENQEEVRPWNPIWRQG
ncbi:DUF3883 domain-containing protein [Corallococcus sp. CA053C]|uniref:DUF3883 domain-containing protein n=1 Tax=Corallococcus sp. CA053C TaxID=2316732 RepID=UPI000EA01EF4|nr:DUF3883 domain-containing protein [Corallococcus sp. CA053C]RKH12732.1 DUF3883 domain-containing protein [Corallococcus sp. CA053C]